MKRLTRVRLQGAAVALVAGTVPALMNACSSSEPARTDSATVDAAVPPDSGLTHADATVDVGVVDAGVDAAPDGSSEVTATLGTSGRIVIWNWRAEASFWGDDTILLDADDPDCVAYVRSVTKPMSPVGNVVLNSALVGTPGGPPGSEVVLTSQDNYYTVFFDEPMVLFPVGTPTTVQVRVDGQGPAPDLPVTVLRSPGFGGVVVDAPLVDGGTILPDGGTLRVSSSAPLDVRWMPPTADAGADAKMVVVLYDAFSVTKSGEVRCEAPVNAGQKAIPASLLSAVRGRLESAGPVDALLRLCVGDRKNVHFSTASYVVELCAVDGTTAPSEHAIILE